MTYVCPGTGSGSWAPLRCGDTFAYVFYIVRELRDISPSFLFSPNLGLLGKDT